MTAESRGFLVLLLLFVSVVFAALGALVAGGVWTGGPAWFLDGAVSAMAAAFFLRLLRGEGGL